MHKQNKIVLLILQPSGCSEINLIFVLTEGAKPDISLLYKYQLILLPAFFLLLQIQSPNPPENQKRKKLPKSRADNPPGTIPIDRISDFFSRSNPITNHTAVIFDHISYKQRSRLVTAAVIGAFILLIKFKRNRLHEKEQDAVFPKSEKTHRCPRHHLFLSHHENSFINKILMNKKMPWL